MKERWVHYNISSKKFNSFTQNNFETSDNVVALRWKIGNSHQTRYYDISGMFKWVFRKVYLGEIPITPEDRFVITPYQQSRIRKMYFSLHDREYNTYSDFEISMRKERELERDEEELVIPEDSTIPPYERYAELDRLITSTLRSYEESISRITREISTSDRLWSSMERFNSISDIHVEWKEWTDKQRQPVDEPEILRVSRRGMLKDREKAIKTFESTLRMYLETDRELLMGLGIIWNGSVSRICGEFEIRNVTPLLTPYELSIRLLPDSAQMIEALLGLQ